MLSRQTLLSLAPRPCLRNRAVAATIPFRAKVRPPVHARCSYSTEHPGKDGSHSRTENSRSNLPSVLTYSALIATTALVAERWYYGSPAKRNHGEEKSSYGTPDDFKKAIEALRHELSHIDGGVSTDPDDLHAHGFSANDYHPGTVNLTLFSCFCHTVTLLTGHCSTLGIAHTVIVRPQTTEDVVKIVKIANKYRMPVVPYSGATSLEGHFRGTKVGSICVDLSHMDKILAIHAEDGDLVCQPGTPRLVVNDTLAEMGIPLFFPLDPAPTATIGANAVRYGTAKGEWFLNATVVLPNGEVIKTRRRSRKSSAGFDTTKLFIGAEGTLGIVTEPWHACAPPVTIKLAPLLPTTVAVAQFPDVRAATEAVGEILNSGVGIQCVELVDDVFMQGTNLYGASKKKWPEKDSLFFKFQGPTSASLKESANIVKKIVAKYGATGFQLAKDQVEAEELWNDRKNALYSGLALLPGGKGWSTDVCVPVSKLPELVHETKKDLAEIGLLSTIVGHVGDGNFHALILFKTEEEQERAHQAVRRMVKRAIALDGTCTGEHGVGIGKKEYLIEELGEGTVKLMKTIKKTLDPNNLFNPGKLYPDDEHTKDTH
ncbi:hypothetical protein NMY22_g14101 [Coprinellus aureogranulatus]|nr:hypothetical protein NMY22_g14101 [Coprinellus aureogranulatus]